MRIILLDIPSNKKILEYWCNTIPIKDDLISFMEEKNNVYTTVQYLVKNRALHHTIAPDEEGICKGIAVPLVVLNVSKI